MSHPELQFFNNLSAELEIELTVPAEPVGKLLNLSASPEAKVATLHLRTEVYNDEIDENRELTVEELAAVAFHGSQIKLRGESEKVVSHDAPNGRYFTVRELLQAVEETERQTRGQSQWLGGVDVHHIYFEGIEFNDEDGVWEICWGS